MTFQKIVDAAPALRKLCSAETSIKTAYRIKKLITLIEPELSFFNEKRDEILRKFSDEKDANRIIRDENRDECYKRIEELLTLEIDKEIKPLEIKVSEDIKLSASDMILLEGLVIFTEDENNDN